MLIMSLLILAQQTAILTHRRGHRFAHESKKMSINIGDGVGEDSLDIEAAPGENAQAFDDTTHIDKPLKVHNEEEEEEHENDHGEAEDEHENDEGNDSWDVSEGEDWDHSNELDQAELEEINEDQEETGVSFPEDEEEFNTRQKLLLELVEKLESIRSANEHVTEAEVEVTDIEAIEGLLKGFHALREHDQTVALHSNQDEEEDSWYSDLEDNQEHDEEFHDWDEAEDHEHEEDHDFEEEFWHEDGEEHEHEGDEEYHDWDEAEEHEHEEDEHDEEHEHEHEHEGSDHEDHFGSGDENEEETEEEHHEPTEEDEWEHVEEEIEHEEEVADAEHEDQTGEESEEEKKEAEQDFLNKLAEKKTTNDDVTSITIVIQGLMKIYNNIFLDFPKEVGGDIETQNQELERAYEQIKEFIHEVVNKKDTIQKEVDYVKEHMSTIKYSREEVLEFYSYRSLWENLENMADERDEDWIQKKKIMDMEVTEFVENVKEVGRCMTKVESLQELIWNETQFVRDQMNSEKSISVQEKVTGLPTLIQKLVEIKFDIDKELNLSALRLKQIKEQRLEFKESLTDMKVYLGVDKTMREGVSRLHIFKLMFFLWVLLIKIERD